MRLSWSATIRKGEEGFSLVEAMITVSVVGGLCLGAASLITNTQKRQNDSAGDMAAIELAHQLTSTLKAPPTPGTSNRCTEILQFDNRKVEKDTFRVEVEFKNGDSVLKEGSDVPGTAVGIKSLRLDNAILLHESQSGERSYVADLQIVFLVGKNGSFAGAERPPRQIARVVVDVSAKNEITGCRSGSATVDLERTCDATAGLNWNESLSRCEQILVDAGENRYFKNCPAGTVGKPPNCRAMQTTCKSGRLAQSFDLGRVDNCERPEGGLIVGIPRASVATGQAEGSALPQVAPTPKPEKYEKAEATITVKSSASRKVAASCSAANAVGEINKRACVDKLGNAMAIENADCNWAGLNSVSVADECVAVRGDTYVTPDLASTPADTAPPVDQTCQCNNRRIGPGEFCMYCVSDVDLGYGWANYSYGVAECTDGELREVNNPVGADLESSCNGTYGRATKVGGKFRQYQETP